MTSVTWPVRDLIGVIDLLGGQAVAAVAGQRESYRPIQFASLDGPPGDANALVNHYRSLGIMRFYIADLDALMGGTPQFRALRDLVKAMPPGAAIWWDAGITANTPTTDWQCCHRLIGEFGAIQSWKVILASESVRRADSLPGIVNAAERSGLLDSNRSSLCMGIDFHAGDFRGDARPADWIAIAERLRIRDGVVLDVASVGTGSGPIAIDQCVSMRTIADHWSWISGGGVRTPADVRTFIDAGCDGCLIATALQR